MSEHTQPDNETANWGPLGLFAAINLTALSLVAILFGISVQLGWLALPPASLFFVLGLTVFAALPISAMAAQHKLDIERVTESFRNLDPIDQLTGLLDRRFFEMVIEDEIDRMTRTGRPSAVALFEVDQFDTIKERYGRGFGNAVLRQVSVVAHAQLRGPFDKVSRWTDDRFIVLMNDVSIAQAEHICDRLRDGLAGQTIHHKGHTASVTVSFGVSAFPPGTEVDEPLEQAAAGVDKAQRYGGNKVFNGKY